MKKTKRICTLLLAIVLTASMSLQPDIGRAFADNVEQTGQMTESAEKSAGGAENAGESSEKVFYKQLMACSSLTDFEALLCDEENAEALGALTEEELNQLLAHVDEIWTAVTEPTEAETLLKEKALKKLSEYTGIPYRKPAEFRAADSPTEPEKKKGATMKTAAGSDDYIYFDLAAGDVNIGKTTYTGWAFVKGNDTAQKVTGPHKPENKYYIYQSTTGNRATTGYESVDAIKTNNCTVPTYDRVKITVDSEEKFWTDYITNNTEVIEVSKNWDTAAANFKRTSTDHYITFAAGATYDVTIDNIWSTYHQPQTYRTTGGITAHLGQNTDTDIQLKLKGDNRFGNIHYHSHEGKNNQIVFSNGDSESNPGSITVADFPNQWNYNHWCSAIGGNDDGSDKSDGIVINSGVIYAGTTAADNCTALGGGGNEYGGVTINGGKVTAVAATTGTAIGGGIGWGSVGGDANVTINKGEVYAYNFGVDNSSSDKFAHYVPAVAIGGGSSQGNRGNNSTIVTITGGKVYAQCMGGAAIGGGGSASLAGGGATINLTGGTIIAKSTSGTFKGTDDPDTVNIPAGVSIGGGTGKTAGGTVKLNISGEDTTLRTGSIGGGKCTGEGNIGSANVTITGGDITGQVIMAGGAAKSCSFEMSDGNIHGTNVIEGNTIKKEEGIEDPQPEVPIQYLEKNGGAVWMQDTGGNTTITGGTIEGCTANLGGAVYMEGGNFTLSGTGKISGNTAKITAATETTVAVGGMGGGVYVTGGDANINGGFVSGNKAQIRGGGVYVTGGNVNVTGGSIKSNTAGFAPDGVSLPADAGRGGGVYLQGGKFTMTGGDISANHANYRGGGIFLTESPSLTAGIISDNTAGDSGGGLCINGAGLELQHQDMQIFGNKAVENGGGVAVLNGSFTLNGGAVGVEGKTSNTAKKGGGVYVEAETNTESETNTGDGTNSSETTANANVIVESGNVWYNSADEGGGIYLAKGEGDFTLQGANAIISNNTARLGGGVYLYKNPILNQGTIASNTAIEDGGGMYISDCLVELKPTGEVTITGNKAVNGAGIYIAGKPENSGGSETPDNADSSENTGETLDATTKATETHLVGLLVGGVNPENPGNPEPAEFTGNVIFTNNVATESGGAVCVNAGRFQLGSEKVTVTANTAKNGGGVAVLNGNFTMMKGSIGEVGGANNATNGGGVYVSGGQVWLKGGSVESNTATDGGGAYVDGGKFYMLDGSITNNIATGNGGGAYVAGEFNMLDGTIGGVGGTNSAADGGGAYVANGNVTIVDGEISYNNADNNGGGFFISATTGDVIAKMLSGKLNYNTATKNGGGMAVESHNASIITVEIGCLLNHKVVDGKPTLKLNYSGEKYESYADYCGVKNTHNACPEVQNNQAGEIGGGFYMNSDASTLSFYCVEETQNIAQGTNTAGMDVLGGKVIIGDEYYHNHIHDDTLGDKKHVVPWGYVSMDDATLVNGGQVDIYGDMTNPIFKDEVTVDIKDKNDHFLDHRRAHKDEKNYKVHYIENFFGTGLYQALQYDEEESVITIPGALFSHPGYQILGWYTKSEYDPTVEDKNNKFYPVGETFDLKDRNQVPQMGTHPISCTICGTDVNDSNLLELYAIWEANGYTVVFDPNVPQGDTYTGSMKDQVHQYGVEQNLTNNEYKYPGHFFKGWSLNADGSGKIYNDGEKVLNLTDKNGVKVVLYAQWEKCDHTVPERWSYEVTEDGKTLKRICSCGGQTLTATLNAEDTVYDGHVHPATLTLDNKEAWGNDAPKIEYESKWLDDKLNHEGSGPEVSANEKQPFHAGEYTATIKKKGGKDTTEAKVTVTYTIAKADQDAPVKPTYEVKGSVVKINKIDPDPKELTDAAGNKLEADAQYRLTYYNGNDLKATDWNNRNEASNTVDITMDNAWTSYNVEVRYEELDDYNASDITRADAVYHYVGSVTVKIICDEGISYQFNDEKESDGKFNGAKLTLGTQKGYYLVGGEYVVTAKLKKDSASTEIDYSVGKVANEKDQYSITGILDNSTLTITIGKARKSPQVDAKVAPKQVFGTLTNEATTISRDSAFTAAFKISNFDPYYEKDGALYGAYDDPELTFASKIPKDTTVILLDRDKNGKKSYWYYRAENEVDKVALTAFKKMGGDEADEAYCIPKPGTTNGYVNLNYQFIVDFSQSASSYSGDNLKMMLKADAYGETITAPEIKPEVEVVMNDSKFAFSLENVDNDNSLTNSFTCSFSADGAASKWENRASALILKPKTNGSNNSALPPDAQIKAEVKGGGTTYLYKSGDSFIVPLSLLQTGNKTVNLTLQSALFPEVKSEYAFDAEWLISPSKAGKAPVEGDQAGETLNVTFVSGPKAAPSLKSTGQSRLLTANDQLKLAIETKKISDYTVSAALLRKSEEDRIYIGTGWTDLNVTAKELQIPLKVHPPGSYCLMLTVKDKDGVTIIMEVPYYFIIKASTGS